MSDRIIGFKTGFIAMCHHWGDDNDMAFGPGESDYQPEGEGCKRALRPIMEEGELLHGGPGSP